MCVSWHLKFFKPWISIFTADSAREEGVLHSNACRQLSHLSSVNHIWSWCRWLSICTHFSYIHTFIFERIVFIFLVDLWAELESRWWIKESVSFTELDRIQWVSRLFKKLKNTNDQATAHPFSLLVLLWKSPVVLKDILQRVSDRCCCYLSVSILSGSTGQFEHF